MCGISVCFLVSHRWAFLFPSLQPVSFLVVGVLAFTSVRGFLISLLQVFSRVSKSRVASATASASAGGGAALSADAVIALLSTVMGMYFISMVVLMRMSMPPEYSRGITRAVGDIQFR